MRTLFHEFLLIFALVVIGAVYSLVSGLAPLPWAAPELKAGEIRVEDARALDLIWLDAREHEAYASNHIPDAIWFDPNDFEAGLLKLMDAWLADPRPIVVYCSSQSCQTSYMIAEELRDALPNAEIYSLKGGWDEWK
jgi:rhodanese-related sulfurtransferase